MKSWYNLRQENYQDNGTEKEITTLMRQSQQKSPAFLVC